MNMATASFPVSSVVEDDIDSSTQIDTSTLIGSGEYLIVGIRYYTGVAHPGEYINLVREPHNPYDRNAIRVDSLRGEKIGHIKATMAKSLAKVMDVTNDSRLGIKLYGTIPRKGNAYTLPLFLEFYFSGSSEQSPQAAAALQKTLKKDYNFRLSREFGGNGVSASSVMAPKVSITTKKLDWNQQQKALDEMFDKTLSEQYKDLPDVSIPICLKDVTLFEHQVLGIKWMIKKEKYGGAAPFYKSVKEQGRIMHLCEITNCSQAVPPKPIRGSILCDSMGLGKTLQVIGLILLAPPPGVEYKVQKHKVEVAGGEVSEKEYVPMPEESVIRAANVSTLKSVLKAAKLGVSGKKADLLQRIIDGKDTQVITGEHFPLSMRPKLDPSSTSVSSTRCTLIVCPVSVMSSWIHQVNTHVEDGVLSLQMYHGTNRKDLLPAVQAGNVDILLVTYHTLAAECDAVSGGGGDGEEPTTKKSKKETIFDIDFHRIVLDEAVSKTRHIF